MDKTYSAKDNEERMYGIWEKSGAFSPNDAPNAPPFTIIMPPPNANDPLHIGHAMFVTIEDILIRYHRMKGDASVWIPGTDHAGIETQFVFEKKLKKEGKSRFDFDRTTLYQMIWDDVQKNSGIAVSQMKKIGASADWSRFKFTLDPEIVSLVLQTFEKLHREKLVYRDYKLVNYCTRCGTGFSELEVKHEVRKDPMVFIKYGPFTIATVRPETKFRDTALAVHPNDPRYKEHIGKTYEIPGLLGPITMKVVADEDVDPEFGTGIMKVTPAHDFHDYELGKKYNLPVTPIIDFKGKMDFSWFLEQPDIPEKYKLRAQEYHGLHVSKARPLMIQHLKDDGLLVNINEQYEHTVSVCYRCGTLLEPLPLAQFFVKVEPLVSPVLKALDNGDFTIHGAGYDKILKHWLSILKDWNISRQITWGIRQPVLYSTKANPDLEVIFLDKEKVIQSGKIGVLLQTYTAEEIRQGLQEIRAPIGTDYVVSISSPGDEYIQETDTFDTWFSSGQWPVVTLKTNKENDFEQFYPTQVMETAYDILMMWVMRMLMFGIYLTGNVPFKHVYLHGLVRDEKGQKMSKSKGNVINPIDIVDKYGADALRIALVMSTTAGIDSATGENKIRGMRNFTNKIWNAARFIQMKQEETTTDVINPPGDEEFIKHIAQVVSDVTRQLENLKIGLAAETVYNEFWHYFCDEAIEKSKTGEISLAVLSEGLRTFLKLLHPFVPFVTEAVWEKLPHQSEPLLISSSWPT